MFRSDEGTEGWTERNAIDGFAAGDGRYERIVFSWSGFGGASSTERLNCRGWPFRSPVGYGPESADLNRDNAFVDVKEEELWLGQFLEFKVAKQNHMVSQD